LTRDTARRTSVPKQEQQGRKPKSNVQTGEGRRLAAAWLNIMASGIISAGTIPLLTALALEGWGSPARALLLLPCFAFALGLGLHLVGRIIVREKACLRPRVHGGLQRVRPGASPDEDQGSADSTVPFPSERDTDAVLGEFGNDPREAIRALLCDLQAFAADHEAIASRAPSARRQVNLSVRL
jgi:hypothetical protein